MKKITVILLVLILIAGVYLLFMPGGGDVSNVQRTIGESQVYTEAEVAQAMDAVERYFRKNFEGCTLLELTYDAKWRLQEEEWAEDAGEDQAIILTSSFYVEPDGGDGSLNQDDTYREWKWIMVRSKSGTWKHFDHGFT